MNGLDYIDQVDAKADALFAAGEYAEAIALLESAYDAYPERYYEITHYILYCHSAMERHDKSLELVESAAQRGYFFDLDEDYWEPMRALDGAERVLAENQRLRIEAQKVREMKYQVHLPESYTPEKRYPLLLTMHGDSGSIGNIEVHRLFWKPDVLLERDLIVVYVQSSNPMSSGGYGWTEDAERRRRDVRQCYDEILASFAVDSKQVIVSGFSGGALASIDAVLSDVLPAKGFIALCPKKPQSFSRELCESARQRGCRGVIMEGELAGNVPDQQEMATVFDELGFPFDFVINEGVEHWYPDDLAAKLDRAVSFILSE